MIKVHNMILNLVLLVSVCFPNLLPAQKPPIDILDSLPNNFNYRVDTDSFAYFKLYLSKEISYFKESFSIGCNNQIEIKMAFSLTITHPFLFDYHHSRSEKKLMQPVILYAVKKRPEIPDSLIFKALEDYCFYGQVNDYFQSREYIFFYYGHGESLPSIVKNKPLWQMIEKRLIHNLNSKFPIVSRTQEIEKGKNPYNNKKTVKGKYNYCEMGLPPKPGVSSSPPKCEVIIKLKKNNRASAHIKADKAWRRKKWKWYIDAKYVYIDQRNGQGLIAFQMANEFVMYSLSNSKQGGVYLRKLKDTKR